MNMMDRLPTLTVEQINVTDQRYPSMLELRKASYARHGALHRLRSDLVVDRSSHLFVSHFGGLIIGSGRLTATNNPLCAIRNVIDLPSKLLGDGIFEIGRLCRFDSPFNKIFLLHIITGGAQTLIAEQRKINGLVFYSRKKLASRYTSYGVEILGDSFQIRNQEYCFFYVNKKTINKFIFFSSLIYTSLRLYSFFAYRKNFFPSYSSERRFRQMYIPNDFKEVDSQKIFRIASERGFGDLVRINDGVATVAHAPFIIKKEGFSWYLETHLSKKNGFIHHHHEEHDVLIVVHIADEYISPDWYPTKIETERVVPTWNYGVIYLKGTVKYMRESLWIKEHVTQLTDLNENKSGNNWKVEDAPTDFIDQLSHSIIGIKIKITSITGKCKASQNQPEINRAGVAQELRSRNKIRMAEMIEKKGF